MRNHHTLFAALATTTSTLALAVAATLAPAPAHAGFRIAAYGGTNPTALKSIGSVVPTDGESANSAAARRMASNLADDGAYSNPVIKGFGKNLPLSILFAQVLPKGWDVYYQDADLQDTTASWHGARPLTDILDSLAASADLDIEADLDRERLYVSKADHHVGKLSVVGNKGTHFATGLAVQRFQLKAGETLADALTRWAKNSGYSLAWELPFMYQIKYNATFTGTLKDVVGELAKSYRQQGAMTDVEWVFKDDNRVLVVRKYDRRIAVNGEQK